MSNHVTSKADSIYEFIAEFEKLITASNPHAYFELAYTRTTQWMAWICDRAPNAATGNPEPGRKVLANGQGETAEEACQIALESFNKQVPF